MTRDGPRCPRHARPPRTRPAWPQARDAAARGYGWAWARKRAEILARDPVCVICRRAPSTRCDHLKPKAQGGTDDTANLRGVCKPCHDEKTAGESAAGARAARRRRQ